MRTNRNASLIVLNVLLSWSLVVPARAETSNGDSVSVGWNRVIAVSKTAVTLQLGAFPPNRRGSKIHDQLFQALRILGADYVRYVPWLPFPRLGVAELEPPANGKTSWDFSLIDPMMMDFLRATEGHSTIISFSTIPQWLFKTEKPVPYPADPDEITWSYEQGTELRDPSMKELADYYARLASWYMQGGFTDEYGKRHESGHHFTFPYWEVLNEPNLEHLTTPEQYTARYDAIVSAVRKVSPQTKFVGMALAGPSPNMGADFDTVSYFEYFLNHKNHRPGIPLDMISYHAYVQPAPDEDLAADCFTFFDQANAFLGDMRYVEAIRKRLSPDTRTTIDELGSILPTDFGQMKPGYVFKPIPPAYWNLSAATFAYLYAHLVRLGIDVVGESQLLGYPGQFPSVSMLDWETGQPNPRFWMLKLLHDNFGPGDKLVSTDSEVPQIYAQAFITPAGKRKVLLVNKRDWGTKVAMAGTAGATEEYVDQTTGSQQPATFRLKNHELELGGLAVAVVTLTE